MPEPGLWRKKNAPERLRVWIVAGALAGIALASALHLLLSGASRHSAPGASADGSCRIARITQNGELLYEIPLASVTEPRILRIEGTDGAYNIVYITQNGASVTEASCPDQICVRTGEIRTSLLPIVCVPNGLVVQIVDGEAEADAVTY